MLNGRTIYYVSVISYNVFIRIHNIPSSRLSLVQNHSRGKIFHARSSKKIPSRKFSFFVRFLSPSFLDSLGSKDPFPPEETVIYLGRPMIPRAIHERIRRIVLDGSLVAGAHTRRGRRGVESGGGESIRVVDGDRYALFSQDHDTLLPPPAANLVLSQTLCQTVYARELFFTLHAGYLPMKRLPTFGIGVRPFLCPAPVALLCPALGLKLLGARNARI